MRVLPVIFCCALAGCATAQHQPGSPEPAVALAPSIGASPTRIADYALLCASAMEATAAAEEELTGMPNETLNSFAQAYTSLAVAHSSKQYVQSKGINATEAADTGHAQGRHPTKPERAVAIARDLQSMRPQLLACMKYASHFRPPDIPIP